VFLLVGLARKIRTRLLAEFRYLPAVLLLKGRGDLLLTTRFVLRTFTFLANVAVIKLKGILSLFFNPKEDSVQLELELANLRDGLSRRVTREFIVLQVFVLL